MKLPPIAHGERLMVVVGPSGAGKDSVLQAWRCELPAHPRVHFAQRVITRAPDASEAHECVSPTDFERLRAAGGLATWWQANGLCYGVRRGELAALGDGAWVVLNGSRAHLPALRTQAPNLLAVEVTAPPAVRAQRLAKRGREDAAAVADRLGREIEVPVSLRLCNAGPLEAAVSQLQAWWDDLQQERQLQQQQRPQAEVEGR